MTIIHNIDTVCVWLALVLNGWLLWKNQKLLNKLKHDTRIVDGYRAYYEDRAKKEGINYPFPTPDELEGEEE